MDTIVVSETQKSPANAVFGGFYGDNWERGLDPWHEDVFPHTITTRCKPRQRRCSVYQGICYRCNNDVAAIGELCPACRERGKRDWLQRRLSRAAFILLALVLIAGCESLPARIAEQAATGPGKCWGAAWRTARAIQALEYREVAVCVGLYRKWETARHAWVEYVDEGDDVVVVDPYRLLDGVITYDRSTLTDDMYRVEMRFELAAPANDREAELRERWW